MLAKRVISGIGLVILALIVLISGGPILALTLCAISLIGFHELCKACGILQEKGNTLEISGYLFILLYYALLYFTTDNQYLILTAVFAMLVMLGIYVFTFPKIHANQVMAAVFSFAYAPVMFSFIYLIRNLDHGVYLVWFVFIASWVSDTCAFFVGIMLGKHKLAPVLSPKKSIEGSVGGILGSAVVGALFGGIILMPLVENPNIIWICALLGGIGSVISQIGDLAASAIKRDHEIKDYGNLIPGHGGILDRFDSVLVTAPIIYFLCIFLI